MVSEEVKNNISEVSLNFDADERLGELIAKKKIDKLKQGLTDGYQSEIKSFVKEELNGDYQQGQLLALALREGSRRSLLKLSLYSTGYSLVGFLVCLLVGWKPQESLLAIPASIPLAIVTTARP